MYALVQHKYYVDEIYNGLIVGGCMRLGLWLGRFDLGIIDGAVNGAAWMTRLVSKLSILFDGSVVDGAVNGVAHVHQRYGHLLRRLQTGYLYNYALAVVLGMVLLISFVLIY